MKTIMTTFLILMSLAQMSTFAADKTKKKMEKHMEMTSEQRQKMATAHESMATCLRSDKSAEECHKEMMDSCVEAMGKDGCHMKEKMHWKK